MIEETKKSRKTADKFLKAQAKQEHNAHSGIVPTSNVDTEAAATPSKTKKEVLRTLKFLFFSLSAGIIQFGVGTLFIVTCGWTAGSTYYYVGYIIALTLSVIWNFTFNRKFTFQSTKNVPIAMMWVIIYYAIFTPLSIWWQNAWGKLPGWEEGTGLSIVILIVTILINGVTEFLWQRLFVYRKTIDTNKHANNTLSDVDDVTAQPTTPIE